MPKHVFMAIWIVAIAVLWWSEWMGYDRTLRLLGNVGLTVFVLYQLRQYQRRHGV